jgi:hypothetical protein
MVRLGGRREAGGSRSSAPVKDTLAALFLAHQAPQANFRGALTSLTKIHGLKSDSDFQIFVSFVNQMVEIAKTEVGTKSLLVSEEGRGKVGGGGRWMIEGLRGREEEEEESESKFFSRKIGNTPSHCARYFTPPFLKRRFVPCSPPSNPHVSSSSASFLCLLLPPSTPSTSFYFLPLYSIFLKTVLKTFRPPNNSNSTKQPLSLPSSPPPEVPLPTLWSPSLGPSPRGRSK